MRSRSLLRIMIWSLPVLLCSVWALAASRTPFTDDDPPQFSEWTAPVNLGPPVNTVFADVDPFISKNGLSLYFVCQNCPGGFGGFDIWVSQRASVSEPWGPPQNLGSTINTPASESTPFLSSDEHRLYFTSDRPGGFGGSDLYVSRRHNRRNDFGWRYPENLGIGVNTPADEAQPGLYEDDATGVITLYFASTRPGGLGNDDIYASTLDENEENEVFDSPVLVLELSSPAGERRSSVRRDGLEMFLVSNRPGSILNPMGNPSVDIWVSTRASTSDPWSTPVNADPLGLLGVNSNRHDGGPLLSSDGETLYFHAAQRAGNLGVGCPSAATCFFDIWMTTRSKLRHRDDDGCDEQERRRSHREHRLD